MPSLVKKKKNAEPEFLPNTLRIAELAADKKAVNIKAYDVRGLTLVADCFVCCTARSEPQVKAVFKSVQEGLKKIGIAPLHVEGSPQGGWLLIDYGDILVHIFREEAREFYDLDGLWGDAPLVDLHLEDA